MVLCLSYDKQIKMEQNFSTLKIFLEDITAKEINASLDDITIGRALKLADPAYPAGFYNFEVDIRGEKFELEFHPHVRIDRGHEGERNIIIGAETMEKLAYSLRFIQAINFYRTEQLPKYRKSFRDVLWSAAVIRIGTSGKELKGAEFRLSDFETPEEMDKILLDIFKGN